MGTFHSVFARILRSEAAAIGYQSNFTIYDQSDARSLVKNIIREMQLDDKVYKPNTVADQISMAKNHLILPDAFPSCSLFNPKHPQVATIYTPAREGMGVGLSFAKAPSSSTSVSASAPSSAWRVQATTKKPPSISATPAQSSSF